MNRKMILALLLASSALASPAYANYFHNPFTGINLNIGSAPNPTPADIREGRLPIVTQDDATSSPPVADAGKSEAKPTAPAAQTQTTDTKVGTVASASTTH
jgi:hypothetical protein